MDERGEGEAIHFTVGAGALRDYWTVYLDSIGLINDAALLIAREDPAIAGIVDAIPLEVRAEQQRLSIARLEKGINGDWSDYVTTLRREAAVYADMGVPFRSWYPIVTAVQRAIFPQLVAAYHGEPPRLSGALLAGQELMDGAMALLAETYLNRKQGQVEEQRALAESRSKELEASQHALRSRGAILEAVIGAMTDGVALRKPNGELLVVNERAHRLLSASLAEEPGAAIGVFHADGRTPVRAGEGPLSLALAGKVSQDVELVLRDAESPDGMRLLADGHPIHVDNQLVGGLLTFRDVTALTRLQELQRRSDELERQNALFQEASRLKSEFVANMSHELRTPLNAILGFSELIRDGIAGPVSAQQAEYLDDVLLSSRHLLKLINDMLDLAKVEAGKLDLHPEDLDLAAVAREIVAVLRTTSMRKRLTVVVEADPALPRVRLDPARLKQVLFNYLSNALKFTPQGGQITLRLRPEGTRAVCIEVTDTGPGIAEADLARLFREFEQVGGESRGGEGTGLGLALTRRLVEAMGGSVGVHSRIGEGSTFTATLPSRMDRGDALPRNIALPGASQDAPLVLVVEDDAEDKTALVRILHDQGYAVETAATAAQAIIRCRVQRFDAITLDLVLPDSPGLDVLRVLREEQLNRETPVIIVSFAAHDHLPMGFPVSGVLMKPVNPEALRAALRRAGVSPLDNRRVLVVDDDPASLRLAEATLQELGYQAVSFTDAREALASIREERPSSILLDLLMPEMDGLTFLERLRSDPATTSIPVLIWTIKDLDGPELAQLRHQTRTVVLEGKRSGNSLLRELERALPAPPLMRKAVGHG